MTDKCQKCIVEAYLKQLVGLISATEKESVLILKALKKNKDKSSGVPVYKGVIGKTNVVHVISGMGKTNASHAATVMMEKFAPSFLINFGIGGAYPSSGLKIGDIAVASKEIYGDEGLLLKDGFHTADAIGIPLLQKGGKKYFNEFPLDKKIVKKVLKLSELLTFNSKLLTSVKSGSSLTVSTCTGTDKKAKELEMRFKVICENMEGAAVAHICAMYGIPMLEARGISNIVGDRDRSKWDIKTAAENCQKAIMNFLCYPKSA